MELTEDDLGTETDILEPVPVVFNVDQRGQSAGERLEKGACLFQEEGASRSRRGGVQDGVIPLNMEKHLHRYREYSLHPNIIVHVENVVSLFSSTSTSSQKLQKCGGHTLLDRILVNFDSPELPKFAEMLLETDVAFITP